MSDTLRITGPESAPAGTPRRRKNTEEYKTETLEFLNKAWGKEEWKPPTNIPRRDGKGTPIPPNRPWTVGELDVLKDITIAALSRDILPLCALYEPGGAIFEAAVDSGQLRWCIKICANARREVRESAEPRLTKKKAFDMVMAGALDGKARLRDPEAAREAYYSCVDYYDCLFETPSFAEARPVCHCGLRESDPSVVDDSCSPALDGLTEPEDPESDPKVRSIQISREKLLSLYPLKEAKKERRSIRGLAFGPWGDDHHGYPSQEFALLLRSS